MKKLLPFLAALSASVLLSACAGMEFPKDGTPSAFDGNWTGTLPTTDSQCADLDLNARGEVRYGVIIAEVFNGNTKKYDMWGKIEPDGSLAGNIGLAGISGATAALKFEGNSASGTWKASKCQGTVSLQRQ